jgi:hypothetical protein
LKKKQARLADKIDFDDEAEMLDEENEEDEVCQFIEKRSPSSTQAYMLVYIRDKDYDRIL